MNKSATDEILSRIAAVVPPGAALHEPEFIGNEEAYVTDCIRSGWVSTAGSYVERFEQAIAEFTGAATVSAVSNGTVALHAALYALGIGVGDEVIVPALTFVATANAVSHAGAIPHFVDVSEDRAAIDPVKLELHLRRSAEKVADGARNRQTGRRIAAVIVMHCFGHPADMVALQRICDDWNLLLIEDAAESLGSWYRGCHTGRIGRIGVISFNGNKTVTTGGGGAILCEDPVLGRRIKHLTSTARIKDGYEFSHDLVGFNYRLPNINAALGVAQMEQLPRFIEEKRRLAERYLSAFRDWNAARIMREPEDAQSNYWLNALVLDSSVESLRDQLLADLHNAGYQCRPAWKPMHQLPMYAGNPRDDLAVTESLHRRIINLPSSAKLGRALGAKL